MSEFLSNSAYFGVLISLAAYGLGSLLRSKLKCPLINPLLISIILTIPAILLLNIDYATYEEGAHYLSWLLTPATVALAVPLYEQFELLKKNNDNFQYKVEWGTDLQTEHERYLTEQIFKKPVFVTDYPKEIKAFYMRQNEDGKTVAAADMLVPGIGELIGGSQREERLDVLEARMKELGLNTADYDWYLDLRRYGSVKHAGYGLGFERLLMYVTGIPNIRDVIPFPRTCGGF